MNRAIHAVAGLLADLVEHLLVRIYDHRVAFQGFFLKEICH